MLSPGCYMKKGDRYSKVTMVLLHVIRRGTGTLQNVIVIHEGLEASGFQDENTGCEMYRKTSRTSWSMLQSGEIPSGLNLENFVDKDGNHFVFIKQTRGFSYL